MGTSRGEQAAGADSRRAGVRASPLSPPLPSATRPPQSRPRGSDPRANGDPGESLRKKAHSTRAKTFAEGGAPSQTPGHRLLRPRRPIQTSPFHAAPETPPGPRVEVHRPAGVPRGPEGALPRARPAAPWGHLPLARWGTYLLKQCAAVSTQQLLRSVAPHRSRPSPRGVRSRSDACHGQPPLPAEEARAAARGGEQREAPLRP